MTHVTLRKLCKNRISHRPKFGPKLGTTATKKERRAREELIIQWEMEEAGRICEQLEGRIEELSRDLLNRIKKAKATFVK